MIMPNTKTQRYDRHGNLIEDNGVGALQDGDVLRCNVAFMDARTNPQPAPQQIVRDEIQAAQDRAAAHYDQRCQDMQDAWRDKPQAPATAVDSGDAYADYCARLNNAWRG